MDWMFHARDLAIVFATLFGPILAVQAQKWVERGYEKTQRRVAIFRTLMATRAVMLSPEHVAALNAIPIEFYGKGRKLKKINDAWKDYLDHLSQPTQSEGWAQKKADSFNTLMSLLSEFLGYQFTPLELKREVYFPVGHSQLRTEQEIIRHGLAALFRGEFSLPMDVKTFPDNRQFTEDQIKLQERLLSWLAGEITVKVSIGNDITTGKRG